MPEPGPEFDTASLDSYLSAELDVEVVETAVLNDGLNLSLALSTADDGRAYVLRRPNKLRDRETFLDLHQEYAVLQRLQSTPIPAPEPVLRCDDEAIIGDPFLVLTYLDGETVPLGSALPERFRNPGARRHVATSLIEMLAEIHSLEVERFADVCERRTIREQVTRITDQLEGATAVTGRERPALWDVVDWLQQNVPPDEHTAFAHGDYRPGNVLLTGTDRPELTGVIDWETAFLGDPLIEVGYLLLRWRDDGDPTPPLAELDARYSDDAVRELKEINQRGLAPFTSKPGSPSRRELVTRYEELRGSTVEHERFYRALAACTLATVWEDLDRLQLEAGAASNRGHFVEYLSMLATSIVNGDLQL